MNRTETEFSHRLQRQYMEHEIFRWGFEEITLRWGDLDPISYTPDFTVIMNDEVTHKFIEVKGARIWPKDMEKFKAARNQFGHYDFELWQKTRDGWERLY